jgi:hypothetical protein
VIENNGTIKYQKRENIKAKGYFRNVNKGVSGGFDRQRVRVYLEVNTPRL